MIVASRNGRGGMAAARDAIAGGGSALDAVVAGCRVVERDPDDHSVGLGGLPNLLGEVELDAAVMDGATRAAGAVAALRGYEHPISVARRVMEETPHVLLVGEGAALFAREQGFEPAALLTPEARRLWEGKLRRDAPDDEPGIEAYRALVGHWRELLRDPERHTGGTVNFLALDAGGQLAAAVSTSGWYYKWPGRVGDSPLVGAGLYADGRYGAAACTGRGEMAIRAATAFAVVAAMRRGASPEEASYESLEDADGLEDAYGTGLNVVALAPDGRHAAASNRAGATYVHLAEGMHEPEVLPRPLVGDRTGGGPTPP